MILRDKILYYFILILFHSYNSEKRIKGYYLHNNILKTLHFLLEVLFLFSCRKGHEGHRLRNSMAPKMMTPKFVQENVDDFNAVTGDFIKRLKTYGNENDSVIVVKDLLPQLLDWGTECKYFVSIPVLCNLQHLYHELHPHLPQYLHLLLLIYSQITSTSTFTFKSTSTSTFTPALASTFSNIHFYIHIYIRI